MSQAQDDQLKHLLRQVITLISAVSICMGSVVVLVRILRYSRNEELQLPYVRYPVEYGTEQTLLMNSFTNVVGFLSMLMIVNCTLVLLYKKGYTNIIQAWLMSGSCVLLFMTTYYYMGRFMFYFNTPMDHFTSTFLIWNIGMTGMAALYFKGPFILQQGYLIYMSVIMAVVLEETFPESTSWVLLVLISVWDIFAVLCVVGPLRILLETAKERNEPLFPALVFSTSSVWCYDLTDHGDAYGSCGLFPNLQKAMIRPCSGRSVNPESKVRGDSLEDRLQQQPSVEILCGQGHTSVGTSEAPKQATHVTPDQEMVPQDAPAPSQRDVPLDANSNNGASRDTPSRVSGTRPEQPRAAHGSNVQRHHCRHHHQHHIVRHSARDVPPEDRGMKMGLGDFIFYSLLVGKASRHGTVSAVVFCYVFIVIGIFFTLILLIIFRKPLPALPLSISLGILAYFSTITFAEPFLEDIGFTPL